jgi:hypothetical protein
LQITQEFKINKIYTHDVETLQATALLNHDSFFQNNFNFYNFFLFEEKFSKNPNRIFNSDFFFENLEQTLLDKTCFFLICQKLNVNQLRDYKIFENYLFFKNKSFIQFFKYSMVDVPICFKKSKSLKNKNFEIFILKFSNLIMRDGKKEKSFRLLLNSFFEFYDDLKKKNSKKLSLIDS